MPRAADTRSRVIIPLGDAVADLERAREAPRRLGDLPPEINSLGGIVWALLELAGYMNARLAAAERGRAVVGRLGAFRYDPPFLMTIGRRLQRLGERRAGLKRLPEAVSPAKALRPILRP